MTAGSAQPITVRILDKEYRVMCEPGEREALLAAAKYLNDKMLGIRSSGRVVGTDRLAVMAALNISHDLLRMRNEQSSNSTSLSRQAHELTQRVERALSEARQLSL